MKPLKNQVSFSKERTLNLLRRSDSAKKEKSTENGQETKSKLEKRGSRWSKLRRSETQKNKETTENCEEAEEKKKDSETSDSFLSKNDKIEAEETVPPTDKEKRIKKHKRENSYSKTLANSIAATLSPFSSFVSSYSPLASRKSSTPSPTPFRDQSPPPGNSAVIETSDQNCSYLNLPWDQNHPDSKLPSSENGFPKYFRHSWADTNSSPLHHNSSPTPKLQYSTPSSAGSSPCILSPPYSSGSSSLSEEERSFPQIVKPDVKIILPHSCPIRKVVPYSIEDGWSHFHSTDFVAKHRKTCQSCRCTRELHDVYHEDWVNVRERLGLGDSLGRSSREKCLQEGYSWIPPQLTSEQIYDYMCCLPGHKVPRLGTPGEKYRERQLMLQLPKQDLALSFTRHVEPQYQTSFKDFVAARNDIALDIGIAKHHIPHNSECRGCNGPLPKGSVCVVATRLGDNAVFHPACFVCSTCSEFLVDLVYCVWGNSLQCGRHYAEKLKPRCSACDEVRILHIFNNTN